MGAAGFGVARIFAGIGLQNIKPLHGSVISLVFGWLLALAVVLVFQFKALISVSPIEMVWLSIIGVLSFALGRGLSFLGIKYIGISRSTTVYASYPIFTMALAIPLLGERISFLLVIGVLLIIGGLTLLLSERKTEKTALKGANRLLGIGFSLASAISYGANTVLIKWVVSGMVNPLVTVAVSLFFGTLALSVFSGKRLGESIRNSPRSAGFFILSGLAMTAGSLAFYSSLSLAPAVVVTPLGATSPLFAVLGTYLFLRKIEKVTYQVVAGCLMVVAGGVLVTVG
ncbi:MAG: DMT family transporter [Chloroflexi bacterium]|nr:DMT family transporter [Chloroflexota bacterium]